MSRLRAPLICLGVLQVLDLITTHQALSVGGIEQNALAACLLGLGGFYALAAAKGLLVASIAICAQRRPAKRALAGICTVSMIYAAVVCWNTVALTRYAA